MRINRIKGRLKQLERDFGLTKRKFHVIVAEKEECQEKEIERYCARKSISREDLYKGFVTVIIAPKRGVIKEIAEKYLNE